MYECTATKLWSILIKDGKVRGDSGTHNFSEEYPLSILCNNLIIYALNSNHLNQGKFMYIIRYNKYTNYFLVPSILSIWLPFLDNKKIDINIMFSSLRISKKMIRMKREDEGEERRLHKLITEMIICVNDASEGIIEY